MHDNFINRIMQLCLLDSKSHELLKYILEIVAICLKFRELLKYFILNNNGDYDSNSESDIDFEERRN